MQIFLHAKSTLHITSVSSELPIRDPAPLPNHTLQLGLSSDSPCQLPVLTCIPHPCLGHTESSVLPLPFPTMSFQLVKELSPPQLLSPSHLFLSFPSIPSPFAEQRALQDGALQPVLWPKPHTGLGAVYREWKTRGEKKARSLIQRVSYQESFSFPISRLHWVRCSQIHRKRLGHLQKKLERSGKRKEFVPH